jgi:anti-sigma factor RsiW
MRTSNSHPRGEKILAFLDGELPPPEAEAVREHCRTCEKCRQVVAELSAVQKTLRGHMPSEPLRPIWPAVRGRLERTDRLLFRPAFTLVTTAAVLVGVFLGVLFGSIGDRSATSETSYIWSAVGSSFAEEDGGTLPDIYTTTTSEEGS